MITEVSGVEVVAHQDRVTVRFGEVFLEIDSDPANLDVEVSDDPRADPDAGSRTCADPPPDAVGPVVGAP